MLDDLRRRWSTLRSSYWFIPAVMTLGALAMAIVALRIDAVLGAEWIERWEILGPNQPEGARSLLSTVAGSMITVAGVTFSVTIVAVVYATSQYGPRLLTNFMRDAGNQFTLGTFTATYLYCIVVLRVIRSSEGQDAASAFVPHVSILIALLLAIASVGVLIYFFHHVPESIHASNVVGSIGRKLEERTADRFPSRIATDEDADPDPEPDLPGLLDPDWTPVTVEGGGYVQFVALDRLLSVAEKADIRLRVGATAGSFVPAGTPLCHGWPVDRVDDETRSAILDCFSRGNRRTQEQDVVFLTRELVEIAARALSPGVNDPFTAINCVDWIMNGLAVAGRGHAPRSLRSDAGDQVRVVAASADFGDLAEVGLAGLRPYVARDRNAALHMAKRIAELARSPISPHARHIVEAHAGLFVAACEQALPYGPDYEGVRAILQPS